MPHTRDMENIAAAAPTLTLVGLALAHIGGFLALPFLPSL